MTSEHVRFAVRRHTLRLSAALVFVLAVAAGIVAFVRGDGGPDEPTVVAVGLIEDYPGGDTSGVARTLPELLTTNLSRLDGVYVVSRSRLYDLMAQLGEREPSARALARSAQRAGVDALLEGALYRRPDGTLRLDLRLIELRTGVVRPVQQAEARDVFALADSATVRLASGLGVAIPAGLRAADVTTTSLAAFRFYEEGMRALQQSDPASARRLFDAALAGDSIFAMAAFGAFQARLAAGSPGVPEALMRAVRLADRATERERLVIRATWAEYSDDPSHLKIAETLAGRYPGDPESHLLLGNALLKHGDFAGALVAARQTLAMDSLALGANSPRCLACSAMGLIVHSYALMDSLPAASRVARDWVARQPSSASAWRTLREVLTSRGDSLAALAAHARAHPLSPFDRGADLVFKVTLAIQSGDFSKADRLLGGVIDAEGAANRGDALWWLTISQRHQGRLTDALASSTRLRRVTDDRFPENRWHHAQVLFELGRYADAAALFDSAARAARVAPGHFPPNRARREAWLLTHKSSALAALGKPEAIAALPDSIRALGARSGYGRDQRLHHHVRAVLWTARRRKEEAVAEFRRAMWSPVGGYTRSNLELGLLLLDLDRPHEAIPVLRAALHGGLQASCLYVTHTEIHAVLSRAFAGAGHFDSAAVHRQWVERALVSADAPVRARIGRLLDGAADTPR